MDKIKKIFISGMLILLISPGFVFAETEVPSAPITSQEQSELAPEAPPAPEPPVVPTTPEVQSEPAPTEVTTVQPDAQVPAPETPLTQAPTELSAPNENSQSVENHGENQITEENKTEVSNNGNVNNEVKADANTGENNANYNTGDANVSTGDANVVLSILNLLNTNFITGSDGKIIFLYKDYFQDLIGNYILDPSSGEAYDLNGSRIMNNLILNNNANLNNDYDLTANTGGNSASYNTGNGSVSTGDANISLNVLNFLNSNFLASESGLVAVVNVFGNWIGNLLVPQNLMPNSNSTVNGNGSTNITNNATVTNNIDGTLNTGGNQASYNTGSGQISTGEALVDVAVSNILNQNIVGDVIYFTFVNVLGNWNGQDLLGITGSGASSGENNTSITNNALINNTFHLFVNTGDNTTSYNTGSGQITTGDARAAVNLINFANLNVTGKKIVILMINVFGDWTGNIQKEETSLPGGTKVVPDSEITPVAQLQVFRVPVKNARKFINIISGGERKELGSTIAEGVLSAEDFNYTINDFPNLLNAQELTPQVAAISDVVDLTYRYLFVAAIITLITFGIVYARIRKGVL